MIPSCDPDMRQFPEYHDSLQLYRARIYQRFDPGDDRLQVRIVPHMADIAEKDLLPIYPPFFKGQIITGRTEKKDKDTADYVWVAAVPDFTVGFILGPANTYEGNVPKYSQSLNYKALTEALSKRNIIPPYMDYRDMYVQYWNESYVEMVNIKTGDKFIAQSSGNVITLQTGQIYMRVGSGQDGGENKFSSIRMTRDEISISAPHVKIRGTLSIGDRGLYLLTSASFVPLFVNGATLHPLTDAKA
jgi:hypothetical protein